MACAAGADMGAEINRRRTKSQRDLLWKILERRQTKRKEAGHLSCIAWLELDYKQLAMRQADIASETASKTL